MDAATPAPRRNSFPASFRASHWALKLSFSFSLVVLALVGIETGSWLYVYERFQAGQAAPTFRQELSGYLVFKDAPRYRQGTPISANGVQEGETQSTDASG